MKLEDYGELFAYELAFWSQGLTNPAYGISELGDLSLDLSTKFRALAIMALLVKGDHTLFCHNLIRSAMSRRTYLLRVRADGALQDHHFASGRYGPMLDAISAGDLGLAREIGNLAPTSWRKEAEYQEDYCYAQILRMLVDAAQRPELEPLLAQFEAYTEGAANSRLDVCRALVVRDKDLFEEAFGGLLRERELQIAADEERGQLEVPEVVAERQVFVEGLAVLRLADTLGMPTQREYRYCPSLARLPMDEPFPGE